MDSSADEKEKGVCRDTLLALLDFLVDPLLPSRSTLMDSIPLLQQQSVAKQVHAMVLLYNYYHRKQHPGLAFMEFRSFCELAVDLKPSLHLYFRVAQKTDDCELEEIEKDLSLTEKAIMRACDTSKSLDASKNNPIIDGWPISKVAVFLVDSRKENCILFHSSITQGVWSVIEKEVNVANQVSEASVEARAAHKRKRVMKGMDTTSLQQLAYLAVKETCGINQAELKILDNCSVYSTSKPKTTVESYIMQCTQTNQNMNLVPIKDVLDSLRGSLVDKGSVTPVVEYFHLLPFADKVLDWLKREMSQDYSQEFNAAKEDKNCNFSLPCMQQPLDPPYHFDAVKNTCCDSHPKEELVPSIREQNCIIFHGSGEQNLKDSDFCEATEKVINVNGCCLKEEPVAFTPKNSETLEARNGNNHHSKEEPTAVCPKPCEASEASNDQGASYPYASQPSEEQSVFRNATNFYLDENLHPCNSGHSESEKRVQNHSISRKKEHPTELVVYKKRNRLKKNTVNKISCTKTSNVPAEHPKQEAEQCEETESSNRMGINGKRSNHTYKHVHDQKLMLPARQTDQAAQIGPAMVVAEVPDGAGKDSPNYQITDTAMSNDIREQDCVLVPFGSDLKHLCNSQLTITSKDPSVSKTVLNLLLRKREQLAQQLRNIADEIALCEGNIQTILGGGEDQLAVKIETLVDGCNEISQHAAGRAGEDATLHYNHLDQCPVVKRKKLSEASLSLSNPCRELDAICSKNLWMLPTYILFPLEGGFEATVNVKGVDFDCSSEGTTCKSPIEGRNSAASKILAKLHSLAAKS